MSEPAPNEQPSNDRVEELERQLQHITAELRQMQEAHGGAPALREAPAIVTFLRRVPHLLYIALAAAALYPAAYVLDASYRDTPVGSTIAILALILLAQVIAHLNDHRIVGLAAIGLGILLIIGDVDRPFWTSVIALLVVATMLTLLYRILRTDEALGAEEWTFLGLIAAFGSAIGATLLLDSPYLSWVTQLPAISLFVTSAFGFWLVASVDHRFRYADVLQSPLPLWYRAVGMGLCILLIAFSFDDGYLLFAIPVLVIAMVVAGTNYRDAWMRLLGSFVVFASVLAICVMTLLRFGLSTSAYWGMFIPLGFGFFFIWLITRAARHKQMNPHEQVILRWGSVFAYHLLGLAMTLILAAGGYALARSWFESPSRRSYEPFVDSYDPYFNDSVLFFNDGHPNVIASFSLVPSAQAQIIPPPDGVIVNVAPRQTLLYPRTPSFLLFIATLYGLVVLAYGRAFDQRPHRWFATLLLSWVALLAITPSYRSDDTPLRILVLFILFVTGLKGIQRLQRAHRAKQQASRTG